MGQICSENDDLFVEKFKSQLNWEAYLSNSDEKQDMQILLQQFKKQSNYCLCCDCSKKTLSIQSRRIRSNGLFYQRNKKIYYGNLTNKKPNGSGIMYFQNGYIYKGWFKDGDPDGEGQLTNSEGVVAQKGTWSKGIFQSNFRQYSQSNNQHKVIFHDNSEYVGEGQIKNGFLIKHGKGKFKTILPSNVEYTYDGQWKDDYRHGKGEEIFKSRNGNEEKFQVTYQKDHRQIFIQSQVYQQISLMNSN